MNPQDLGTQLAAVGPARANVPTQPRVFRTSGPADTSQPRSRRRSPSDPGGIHRTASLLPSSGEVTPSVPLDLSDVAVIDELRHILETHGYSEAGLRNALGQADGRPSLRTDLPLYLKRVAARSPLNTLVKLFSLHTRVDADEAREAFAPLALSQLFSLGLLEVVSQGVSARVALSLCDGMWLAHDFADAHGTALAADHVLGVSPATLTLAKLTVQRRADRVLDLGTGCGVQGLLAARNGRHVIAVDTNPRALNFTSFNARLNRLLNVECRRGNLFDPVAGERFELIICNPPYVISPESHYQFRDSGLPGDRICEQVIRAAPAYLDNGGVACVLCNWAHPQLEHWSRRLRDWVADSGCDAVLFHGATQDPLSYAANWTRAADLKAYGEALDRWCHHYRQLGIESLSAGAVILRRRIASHHWVRTEELPKSLTDSCSDQILRLFRAEDFLASRTTDAAVLEHAFGLVDGVHLTQSLVSRQGRLSIDTMLLESRQGLRFHGVVDASTLQFLARCDGRRRLGELIEDLARASQADADTARRNAVALVRQLVALGFLVPSEGAGASGSVSPGGESGPDAQTNPAPGISPAEQRKVRYE